MVNVMLAGVSLVLVLTWTTGDCAPLQVTVSSGNTNTSCVGDQITYTCTVPAVAHLWSIPSLGFSDTITRTSPTFDDPASPFSIVITADGGGANPITTALSVTSFAGLNGANITCSDGNKLITETQDTIAMVFGPPSAPTLTAELDVSSMSITYNITSPIPPCVLNYTIITTGRNGEVLDNVSVLPEEMGSPIIGGTVDVCSTDLTITATPVTMEGNGPNSASIGFVAENEPDVTPQISGETDVIVSWQPVGRNGTTVTIGWSNPGGLDCVNSVEATPAESVAMQRTVSLDCTYNGTSPVFCVNFTSPVGCPSTSGVNNDTAVICRSPSTDSTPETSDSDNTTNESDDAGGSDSFGPIIGGVVGGIVVAVLVVLLIIVVVCVVKKKGDKDSTDSAKPKVTYHSSGATPQTAVTVEEHAPGAMYADPKQIEHEAATTGDQYALITSNTKAKKKNGQPEAPPPAELGDMYSVPDKTKKQQNQTQGLVYADIDIGQPKPAPRGQGSVKQQQQEEEAVTYATVTSPI